MVLYILSILPLNTMCMCYRRMLHVYVLQMYLCKVPDFHMIGTDLKEWNLMNQSQVIVITHTQPLHYTGRKEKRAYALTPKQNQPITWTDVKWRIMLYCSVWKELHWHNPYRNISYTGVHNPYLHSCTWGRNYDTSLGLGMRYKDAIRTIVISMNRAFKWRQFCFIGWSLPQNCENHGL